MDGGRGVFVALLRSLATGCLALAIAALLASACSSPAPLACDPAHCASGNQCIDDHSGTGPRCHEVCTGQTCPFGWYCNDGVAEGQPANWCVQSPTTLTKGPGQWATPCLPSGGEAGNKACDVADGFACYGTSPTDANAFCTIFGCSQDGDCPGGWWCETVDDGPSVRTAARSFGKTRTICLPREYCATCRMDHDCPPAANGTPQHCAQDTNGNGYCTPRCSGNSACPLDARCAALWTVCSPAQGTACQSDDDCPPADGTYQHCDAGMCTPECGSASDCASGQSCAAVSACEPRAGVCVGDGSFCSPCQADTDCDAQCVPRRTLCTPAKGAACESDDDCAPTDGTYQHCDQGMCSPECGADSDCSTGQTCALLSTCNTHECAGGRDCPLCRSDADCHTGGGSCLYADYSTERFCGVPVTKGTCPTSAQSGAVINAPSAGQCPTPPTGSSAAVSGKGAVGCTFAASTLAPANECVAFTSISDGNGGETASVGCWTANR